MYELMCSIEYSNQTEVVDLALEVFIIRSETGLNRRPVKTGPDWTE